MQSFTRIAGHVSGAAVRRHGIAKRPAARDRLRRMVPAQLVARVLPISNTNTPCPITVTQTGPGALRLTRTGPGDPRLGSGSTLGGYCNVGVSDPTTGAFAFAILL